MMKTHFHGKGLAQHTLCILCLGVVDVQRDFTTRVLLKACAGVAAKTIEAAIAEMRAAGVDLDS